MIFNSLHAVTLVQQRGLKASSAPPPLKSFVEPVLKKEVSIDEEAVPVSTRDGATTNETIRRGSTLVPGQQML